MQITEFLPEYELLDSGNGERLERFGKVTLIRPSKFAIWKPRQEATVWEKANASFMPKRGWVFAGDRFGDWELPTAFGPMHLSLQESGQIGVFPEHALYLDHILAELREFVRQGEKEPRVLNLFAYTGLVTLAATYLKAKVTHVDISRRVIEWARMNLNADGLDAVRFIQEDAVTFMLREVRRGGRYNMIVCDPPSFSRISSKQEWTLEEKLSDILQLCAQLLVPGGKLFFTSHHYETGGQVTANLLRDVFADRIQVEFKDLAIKESNTTRSLPSGFLVRATVSSEPAMSGLSCSC